MSEIILPNLFNYLPYVNGYSFSHMSEKGLVFIPDAIYGQRFTTMPGQIGPNTTFGKEITTIAKEEGLTNWVEVGSWNGLGTTLCVLEGFKGRSDSPHLISFELDPMMFNVAKTNLQSHPAFNTVSFVHEKLWSINNITTVNIDNIPLQDQNNPHFYLHYHREQTLYNNAKGHILSKSPQVAILDGGEYSGYFDWIHLPKDCLKWLILDDTNSYKNKKVLEELDSQPDKWTCYKINHADRNGWAIYKRI